jgi:hypothetical protein
MKDQIPGGLLYNYEFRPYMGRPKARSRDIGELEDVL